MGSEHWQAWDCATPGHDYRNRLVFDSDGRTVAVVNGTDVPKQDRDKYARFIAAAPDLLAALKAAEVMLRGCRVFVPKTDVLDATLADVLNAIAKAEGGAA